MMRAAPCVLLAGLVLCTSSAYAFPKESPDHDPLTSNDERVIQYINSSFKQHWQDEGITPSPPAADNEWVRRVFLDLIGRIPTVEEAEEFVRSKDRNKRAVLVGQLLNSDTYIEDYARHWTTVWSNLLIGRNFDADQRRMVNREGLEQYLRRSLTRNKPYNEFVMELVSGEGSNTPGTEEFNGAVNFLLDNLEENGIQATAKTARLFLGMQVQCTQCHNHPFNDWQQDQFWSLNAFFRQTVPLRTQEGNMTMQVKLADQDFAGEGNNPTEAEIYYELRNGTLKVAYPRFVDGTEVSPSGYVNEVNRRDELAKLMVGSDFFGKAIVNRMWGQFHGFGFTKPVDDMGPHNLPSHPELLDQLGKEFVSAGYDIKSLIKWCVLTEPYSLSSKFNKGNETDDPSRGESPKFSKFYVRQMSAEQLYDSLVTAVSLDETARGTPEERGKHKQDWLGQFVIAFGTDEGDESTTFDGTIPQTLMMMNGELIHEATRTDAGGLLSRVAQDPSLKSPSSKIGYLYMAALTRRPRKEELVSANQLWQLSNGDGMKSAQDIWWVLLNSNEFILIH